MFWIYENDITEFVIKNTFLILHFYNFFDYVVHLVDFERKKKLFCDQRKRYTSSQYYSCQCQRLARHTINFNLDLLNINNFGLSPIS